MFSTVHILWIVRKGGQMKSKQDKQDRRSQRTRRLVSAAMIDLLREKRYDAITVQDLLDRADIGRSTFYTHYFDKQDVLASLIEQLLETVRKPLSLKDAGQGIVPSLALFRLAYQHQHQQLQAILHGHAGEMLWETMQTALCRTIEQALATAGAESRSPSVPLALVSEYLAGAFLTLFKWWLEAGMPSPPEQMDKIFRQLALPGVRAMLAGKSA
jgi:AcrR family transcriptional regulator